MERKKMKLFVWDGVLTDYTSGIMFAVAASVEEARVKLLEVCEYIPKDDLRREPAVYDCSEPVAYVCWGGG